MQLRVLTWGEGTLPNALAMVLLTVLAAEPRARAGRRRSGLCQQLLQQDVQFRIPAGELMDALDAFSEQSGLQIIYDQKVTAGRQALGRQRRDATGACAGSSAVAVRRGVGTRQRQEPCSFIAPRTARRRASIADAKVTLGHAPVLDAERVVKLEEIKVYGDPRRVLPNEASTSAFGFNKPLLDTPRAISFISDETIQLFGLSAVEDLVRVVPGTFTTTRFGIQGSVDVRNVPADFFIRGMKRLSLQGHARSVLAAMDTIEIVRGPPSPLFGMGKIGGYVNAVPAAGRAKTGGYLPDAEGFVQGITGAYDRNEGSFGVGGPMGLQSKQGGYYLYGLHEDSNSFTRGVPVRQDVAQGALSIDRFIGPFRLETGANYQRSETAGALTGRLTQDLVDHNRYIRGSPLGESRSERQRRHRLSRDAAGVARGGQAERRQPAAHSVFRLAARCERQAAAAQPVPQGEGHSQVAVRLSRRASGGRPHRRVARAGRGRADADLGLRADRHGARSAHRSASIRSISHRATAFERDLQANLLTGYLDLLYDTDPDFTVRNQLFYDSMDQFKVSNQPLGQKQWVYVWEDKLTMTKRFSALPSWLRFESLASHQLPRHRRRRLFRAGRRLLHSSHGCHGVDLESSTTQA